MISFVFFLPDIILLFINNNNMAREGLRSRKGGEEQVRRAHMQRTHLCDGASDCLLRCSSGAVVAAAQAVTGRYLEPFSSRLHVGCYITPYDYFTGRVSNFPSALPSSARGVTVSVQCSLHIKPVSVLIDAPKKNAALPSEFTFVNTLLILSSAPHKPLLHGHAPKNMKDGNASGAGGGKISMDMVKELAGKGV